MNIRVITEDQEFLSLKNDWDSLSQDLIPVTKFDWLYRWWKHFKGENELNILIAEINGKVVGIAPLFIESTIALKFIPFKRLRFLGGDLSDFLDFLIVQDYNRETVFKAFLDFILSKMPFDLIDFGQINSNYPNFDLWQKYSGVLNLCFCPFRENHKIHLSKFQSYKDYYDNLNKNLKRSLKYRQNKIKKDNADIQYDFKNDITEDDIKMVANINIKRQKYLYSHGDKKRDSYFADKEKENFIKEYFCAGPSDTKMLAYMTCNDVIITYFLILLNHNTIALWNTSFDPKYEEYCPSKFLINELVKYAFENDYKYIDFLRGNDKYKHQWTNELAINYNLIKKKSLKARMVCLFRSCTPDFIMTKLRKPGTKLLDYEEYDAC